MPVAFVVRITTVRFWNESFLTQATLSNLTICRVVINEQTTAVLRNGGKSSRAAASKRVNDQAIRWTKQFDKKRRQKIWPRKNGPLI